MLIHLLCLDLTKQNIQFDVILAAAAAYISLIAINQSDEEENLGNALEGRLKNCRGGLNIVVVLWVLAYSSLDEANASQLSNFFSI